MLRQGSFLFYSNGVNLILPKGVSPACPKGAISRAFSTALPGSFDVCKYRARYVMVTNNDSLQKIGSEPKYRCALLVGLFIFGI